MKQQAKRGLAIVLTMLMLLSSLYVVVTAAEPPEIKNIIFLIGDGMGPNHPEAYRHYTGKTMVMESLAIQGYQDTRSFMGIVTDSGAAATALACGVRTWVSAIGVYPGYPLAAVSYPKNIREVAAEQGMKTGIVCTKVSDDATPAAFSAHTFTRGNSEIINQQQLESGIDVLMGAATGYITGGNALYGDSDKFLLSAGQYGYQYAENRAEMNAITSGKMIGQFNEADLKGDYDNNDTPLLSEMTEKAIALLENEKGFFLMVEGSTIDTFSHDNNMDGLLDALAGFDRAVQAALDYAAARQDTLVVVTADHETGGLTYYPNNPSETRYGFTSGGHTTTPVAYYVYAPAGVANAFQNGEDLLNTDIPKRIAAMMGWEELFPATVRTEIGSKLDGPLTLIEQWGAQIAVMLLAMIPAVVLQWYYVLIDAVGGLIG